MKESQGFKSALEKLSAARAASESVVGIVGLLPEEALHNQVVQEIVQVVQDLFESSKELVESKDDIEAAIRKVGRACYDSMAIKEIVGTLPEDLAENEHVEAIVQIIDDLGNPAAAVMKIYWDERGSRAEREEADHIDSVINQT